MESKKNEIKKVKNMIINIEKINSKQIIEEALSTLEKKEENSKETYYNVKISEQLNRIKDKALNEYLQSIKNKKMKELKEGIGDVMDKYNKNLTALLIKSNTGLIESNKIIDKLKSQIVDLEKNVNSLQNQKKELLIRIKDLETNLVDLEKKYEMLMSEKKIFDEIKKIYPGLTLSETILEIQMAKKGTITILESYADKNRELLEIKKSQNDSMLHNQKKINSLMEDIRQLSTIQQEDKEKYEKQINELSNKLEIYEIRIKEADYLKNSLYYIYNLLFEKMDLYKDIKIDDKFRKIISIKDFTPNILYDPELVAYIDLIIKRMHRDSYDKIFRECVGYLNVIVRNYFPKNTNLRFKPVDIFKELTNFIDQKIKLIDEYKNSIKYKEMQINSMKMENNKLKEKYDNLSKEYNSYKILIEKNIKFTKNNNNHINHSQEKKRNKTEFNTNYNNFTINSKKIQTQRKKGIILKNLKFSFDIEQFKNNNITNELSRNERRQRNFSSLKKSINYNKYHNKNKSEKKLRKIESNSDMDYIWTPRIEKDGKNKLKIENGNQKLINNLNAVTELVDETNRLFLYRTRMTSYQKNLKSMGLIVPHTTNQKREMCKTLKEKILEVNSVKVFEGKILKKLDNLIGSAEIK